VGDALRRWRQQQQQHRRQVLDLDLEANEEEGEEGKFAPSSLGAACSPTAAGRSDLTLTCSALLVGAGTETSGTEEKNLMMGLTGWA
jgi:hypothetical protein